MSSIFSGGMPALSAFVGCFHLNPLGYPQVAIGSAAAEWRRDRWTPENHAAFATGARAVIEEARRFGHGRPKDADGDVEIPGTLWKFALEGPDQLRLSRPRYSISLDLREEPWTDFLELKKEHIPKTGHRRFISQKIRRTRHEAEPFREIKEMVFSNAELRQELGDDSRALGMLEHQLTMQFHAAAFQPVRVISGHALALSSREPIVPRWKPYDRPASKALSQAEQNAPTPAQGVPLTDPDYPYRLLYESDPKRDYFRLYMSRRDPEAAALSLELGLKLLWERVETYVETTDRSFPQISSARARRA